MTITVTSGDDVTATQSAGAYDSPGSLTVSGLFNYQSGRQLLSLRWQPIIPSGWTLSAASGDGSPEIQQGEAVFVGTLTANPIKFSFTVTVPAGQTGTKDISGLAEYQLSGMVNPATVHLTPDPLRVGTVVYHSTDYRDPRWVIDGTEINRVLSYWRAGSHSVNAAGVDGYAAGDGDTSGRRHSADYREPYWRIDGTEVNRVLSYWRAGGYRRDSQGADGFAAGAAGTPQSISANSSANVVRKQNNSPTISQQTAASYSPGGTLKVINTFSYSGQLLSLLWRPKLPTGWTLVSASATSGSVEAAFGEIVWVGTLPASPITMEYVVQVPASETGNKQIQGEVEYQLTGSVNAVTAFANPNPLNVAPPMSVDNSAPALAITSHSSGQTVSNPAITLAGTASDAGLGNNGISSVTVNGTRATGDTATSVASANWSFNFTLSQGSNVITVVARDNSPSLNSTTQTITVVYQPATPTVTIAATDSAASELGPDAGTFVITRTGSTTSPLTVNYSVGGTAISGADYSLLAGSVNIPIGSSTAAIIVSPIDDAVANEGNETVTITLANSASYTVGAQNSATIAIADKPVVSGKPTISPLADRQIRKNTFTDDPPISFTVSDAETPPENLSVAVSSGNPALVPNGANNIQFVVSGSQRIMIIKPAPDKAGVANITVSVTDSDKNTASRTFKLTVLSDPPSISGISNQTVLKGGSTGALDFTIQDDETFPGFLKLSVDSSNQILVPIANITLDGISSSPNRTVTITPAANQSGTSTITLTVTDQDGLSASTTFDVSVTGKIVFVTASAGANGSIAPSGSIQKNAGESQIFTATPANDFEVDAWTVSGNPAQTGGNTYTLPNIQANSSVSVTFRAQTRVIRLGGDLSFSDTAINTSATKTLVISNEGTSPLTVSSITYPPGFSGNWNGVIDPGKSQNVTVTFTPTAAVPYGGNVDASSNKTGGTNTKAISGKGTGQLSFTNSTRIAINDNTTATPYPSVIPVSGLSGAVSGVTVTLANLSHTYTRDISVLLVGPKGQKVVLMRKAGGKKAGTTGAGNVTLTFSDLASTALPSSAQISTGSFRPSDFSSGVGFLSPAPAGPYVTALSAFNGVDANGNWSLYVADTEAEDVGTIAGGWSLSFTSATGPTNDAPTISKVENQQTLRDTPSALIAVAVADKETAAGSLTFAAVSSNKSLVPDTNIFASGSGANRTVLIAPAAGQVGVTTITLTVADSGGLSASTSFTLTVTQESLDRGDFDGDGRSDLIFQDNGGFLAAWFMDGTNLKSAGYLEPSQIGDSSYHIVASADFDGDDREDLLFQHNDGTLAVWFMDRDRLRDAAVLDPSNPDHNGWRVSAVADFNGDGNPDLVLQDANGAIDVWLMDGVRRTGRVSTTPSGTGDGIWRVVGAGDFNGDRQPDLVFQHANGELAVWYLNNFVAIGVNVNPQNSGSPSLRVVSTVDRNQDGQPDLLFQHNGDGSLLLWLMNGINRTSASSLNPAQPGGTWKAVAP